MVKKVGTGKRHELYKGDKRRNKEEEEEKETRRKKVGAQFCLRKTEIIKEKENRKYQLSILLNKIININSMIIDKWSPYEK